PGEINRETVESTVGSCQSTRGRSNRRARLGSGGTREDGSVARGHLHARAIAFREEQRVGLRELPAWDEDEQVVLEVEVDPVRSEEGASERAGRGGAGSAH